MFTILVIAGYKNEKDPCILVPLSVDQTTDQLTVTRTLEQANTNFRAPVLSILKQVTVEYKLPEPDENFVMVNPIAAVVSPVILTKEATMASLPDLEKRKDILLAYFNLPDDAEIASSFNSL